MTQDNSWVSNGEVFSFGSFPEITNTFDPQRAFPSGEIRLPIGDITIGLLHIQKHHERIAKFHRGTTPLEYVKAVCAGYSEIWLQTTKNAFMLKKYNGVKSAIIATHSSGIYQVVTAFPIDRTINHSKRKEILIWKR